ncbi:MAG: hypothetical protein ABIR70_23070 [Bryobacteraceae bacterium]
MPDVGGGTNIYCPECKIERPLKGVQVQQITGRSRDNIQRKVYPGIDLHVFFRGRQCLSCGFEFLTVELEKSRLDELIVLANALEAVKSDIESIARRSTAVVTAADTLKSSLDVLRALKRYKAVKKKRL